MARPNFRQDRRLAEAVLHNPAIVPVLAARAARVRDRARALAPDDPSTGPPDLRSEIDSEVVRGPRGWVGRVVSRNWKGHFWEFGTARTPARPYLRPALEAVAGDMVVYD